MGVYLCKCRIGIVGGGIGGLALAVALKQRGIDCRCLTVRRSMREAKAGLTLQGARTIRDSDLLISARGRLYTRPRTLFSIRGPSGRILGSQQTLWRKREEKGKSYTTCRYRARRRRGLFDACEELVTWNARVSTVSQRTGDHAIIHFDGSVQTMCDAVVGRGMASTLHC